MSGAVLVLAPEGQEVPTLEEAFAPGSVSALFRIDAGELADLERQAAAIEAYLAHQVPVILEFEDAADAYELQRRWSPEFSGKPS